MGWDWPLGCDLGRVLMAITRQVLIFNLLVQLHQMTTTRRRARILAQSALQAGAEKPYVAAIPIPIPIPIPSHPVPVYLRDTTAPMGLSLTVHPKAKHRQGNQLLKSCLIPAIPSIKPIPIPIPILNININISLPAIPKPSQLHRFLNVELQ